MNISGRPFVLNEDNLSQDLNRKKHPTEQISLVYKDDHLTFSFPIFHI